jgi:hypothetical protein
MVQNEKIPRSVTNWNDGSTEQNGIFVYFGLDECIDQCLTKYKFDQQNRCAMMLPNGSRQQFFMHVEVAMREISIAVKRSGKAQKKNSRLDASLSAT